MKRDLPDSAKKERGRHADGPETQLNNKEMKQEQDANDSAAMQPNATTSVFANLPKKPADAALAYAEILGWRIMPLHSMRSIDGEMRCSCGHDDCEAPAKHPLIKNGDASADPDQIRRWWKKWPHANVGFWLEGSNVAVLDIDIGNGKDGAARLREILKDQPLPATLVCATPSGGKHVYYNDREGLPNKSNALGDGLDIWRGKHYAILPPSNHKKGGHYVWEQPREIEDWPDILMPPKRGVGRPAGTEKIEKLDVLDSDEITRLAHAMTFVDASDRDTWVHFGYIIARLFGWTEDGFTVFNEWAATAANYSEKESRAIYYKDSRNPPVGMALTTAYIFKKAMGNPNYKKWERPDPREKFFQSRGVETDDLELLTQIVARAGLQIYQREARLIEVLEISTLTKAQRERLAAQGVGRDENYCITREVDASQFVRHASVKVAWYSKVRGKYQLADFDRKVVRDFLSQGSYPGMDNFIAFTMHPTIRSRHDPTLLGDYGFDPDSGLFIRSKMPTVIPANPNKKDAKARAEKLLRPYRFFNFIDDAGNRDGHAKLLSLILTIGLRHWFKTAPMFLASAPVVGSGKTKLISAPAALWYGAPPPAMIFVENAEEMEKRIGASVMAGDRVLLFDNVMADEEVNDPTLNMMLTIGQADFRKLGESTKIRMRTPMTLLMTGNQMELGPDLARRTIVFRIDPGSPNPTARSFPFEPIQEVLANRQQYIEDALTIARAFMQAKDAPKLPPVASFEEWSFIRDLLVWLEYPDIGNFGADPASAGLSRHAASAQALMEMLEGIQELKREHFRPSDVNILLNQYGHKWTDLCDDVRAQQRRGKSAASDAYADPRAIAALLRQFIDQATPIVDSEGRAKIVTLKRDGYGFRLVVERPGS